MINIREFSALNWARCIHPDGFNDIPESTYLITCLTEELGEVAKIVKKLKRGFNKREQKKAVKQFIKECAPENAPLADEINVEELEHWWRKKLRAQLGKEVADLFTYLDLFATRHNIDIPTVVTHKFNEVSKEMECNQFVAMVPPPDLSYATIAKTVISLAEKFPSHINPELLSAAQMLISPGTQMVSQPPFPADRVGTSRADQLFNDHLNKTK